MKEDGGMDSNSNSGLYEDSDGEVRLTRSFVGKYRPDSPRNRDHAEGFDRALQLALEVADRAYDAGAAQIADAPKTFRVSVTFEAEVVVRSPGNIGEYKAILKEIGS
jgi:hypothetical protein